MADQRCFNCSLEASLCIRGVNYINEQYERIVCDECYCYQAHHKAPLGKGINIRSGKVFDKPLGTEGIVVTKRNCHTRLKDIVIGWLEVFKFDGLYTDDCGCTVDDLMPCEQPGLDCKPGFKIPCTPNDGVCDGDCITHIGPKPSHISIEEYAVSDNEYNKLAKMIGVKADHEFTRRDWRMMGEVNGIPIRWWERTSTFIKRFNREIDSRHNGRT